MVATVKQAKIEESDWFGCYGDSWANVIVPDAFAHPAKYSRALITRIVDHLIEDGMVQIGDTILDPFGGVALGALPCLLRGLNWQGVELEQKFVDLGNQNLDLWRAKFGRLLKGEARLVQGDSRGLVEVIQGAGGVMSSPPYIDSLKSEKHGIDWSKCKPDYDGRIMHRERIALNDKHHSERMYGHSPGQLGAMREGDHASAIVSSPPYAATNVGNDDGQNELRRLQEKAIRGELKGEHLRLAKQGRLSPNEQAGKAHYGDSPGQLGAMKDGGFEGMVSSPPYEGTPIQAGGDNIGAGRKRLKESGQWSNDLTDGKDKGYGETSGQIGGQSGDTFWQAARAIVSQCHLALAPNAIASWVVKGFVRKGKYVDFPDQWRQLCESVGFETIHVHRCWLTEDLGEQGGLFGESKMIRTERKSFFRRLAESKGSPRVDFEIVLCMRKVEAEA